MKFLKNCFLIVIACVLLAGCSGQTNPESAVSADEKAIEQVIVTCFEAKANWDYPVLTGCLLPDSPMMNGLEDPILQANSQYQHYVENGYIVPADVEKLIAIDIEESKIQAMHCKSVDADITDDTAFVLVEVEYEYLNRGTMLGDELPSAYWDRLFLEICQLDVATAKATLSLEEFSAVCVQVRRLDFENVMQFTNKIETVLPIQMQKADGKWYIVSGML